MRNREEILYDIEVMEGRIHLEKVNNHNHMDWDKYNRLLFQLNSLQEELKACDLVKA